MSWRRKIQYQLENYRRVSLGVFNCAALPSCLTGKTARIICLIILAAGSVGYICQTSAAAGSGYEMNELQNKVEAMEEEIQKIDVQIAEFSSMPSLEKRLARMNMVSVASIKYIRPTGPAFAKK
jgi:hypothetical protein